MCVWTSSRWQGGSRKGGMVSRTLGLQMADSRVARKLGSPCIDGETEAGNFLGSHGDLATEVGLGAVGSGHEMSHFPPR